MPTILNVLVWDEYPGHAPKDLFPDGIRGVVADGLRELDRDQNVIRVETVGLDEPEQGLAEEKLSGCDVLLWWGHARHAEVEDDLAERIRGHVHERGMGFVCLHSGHYAKPFRRVLDCTGHLKGGWREGEPADQEEVTICAPRHPIAQGLAPFTLEAEEMYGAPFDVPPPEVVVLQSFFPNGGEYFPSGLCWTVGEGIAPGFTSGPGGGVGQGQGKGRVFYLRPGHESFRTYEHPMMKRAIYNATLWAGHEL